MKAVYKLISSKKIRLGFALNLIFFALLLDACAGHEKKDISIAWKEDQAVAIVIPTHLLEDRDSIPQWLSIRLEKNASSILGDYSVQEDHVLFQPLVPLTRGLSYEIFFREQLKGRITIPTADATNAPQLLGIYPTGDSLPENLLKIYLQFSSPMQEGTALQNMALLNNKGDTLPNVFLNLQQELWNKERTVLTVWLDPGRIKRDLIPNQQLGNPLQKRKHYVLSISKNWKNVQELPLRMGYRRSFFVATRDDTPPQPKLWEIAKPKSGSRQALVLRLHEALDYFLLQETISIFDEAENKVAGTFTIADHQREVEFVPAHNWQKGTYRIRIASYLEDLAGNNLTRPFDRDMMKQEVIKEENFVERIFVVAQ